MKQLRVGDKMVNLAIWVSSAHSTHLYPAVTATVTTPLSRLTTRSSYFQSIAHVSHTSCPVARQDTAGEERFDALTNFYCRGAACAVVCYDITAHDTFEGLARWVDKLRGEENCCLVLAGNKLDAVEQNPSLRKVELAEAKAYAASIGAEVLEVSAKTGTNVSEAFSQVVNTAFERAGRGGRDLGQQRDARRVGLRAQPQQTPNAEGGCAC